MKASWKHGTSAEIGGLQVGYGILQCKSTADKLENNLSISSRPSDYAQSASFGLRLRMPCGTNVITTVSHAFVRLSDDMSTVRKAYTDLVRYRRSRFQESRLWRQHSIRAGVVQAKGSGNTPLGKTVWLTESDTKVCAMYCFALNLKLASSSQLLAGRCNHYDMIHSRVTSARYRTRLDSSMICH